MNATIAMRQAMPSQEDISLLADAYVECMPKAHTSLLGNLFDLAGESELDHHALAMSAGACIELARRGDRCLPPEGWDFALVKFVTCRWGPHAIAHEALAKVFAAYVEHGVVDINKKLVAPFYLQSQFTSVIPVQQAIIKGNLKTAEQLVLHGCNHVFTDSAGATWDLQDYTEALFASSTAMVDRTDDSVSAARAALRAARLQYEINTRLDSDGPGPGAQGASSTPAESRRARMGL
ncbi:hypothetical protein ABIC83_002745 [Roseateles asaccharophilus]|uniref:hypothetical protein n=1 Tax=Roseateles asaccharophilus TaxID=582607 RepID=UPI00383635AC